MQRAERKKGCSRTSSPSHPGLPSGEGTSSPNKSTSTVLRGPVPHPCPSWGNPTLSWGQSSTRELRGLAWKDGGCRSRGRSPPDPTQPSLTACPGGGGAGPPLSPPCPTLRLAAPPPGQGASPGASFMLPEWRVSHHPPLGYRGIPRTPDPSVQ